MLRSLLLLYSKAFLVTEKLCFVERHSKQGQPK
ncbi:hypothetical protein ABIC08_004402 [Bradyrhizobium sp. RT9b]